MTAKGNTHHGWWYENSQSMSLSWSVAHSFRWYLSGAQRDSVARKNNEQANCCLGMSFAMTLMGREVGPYSDCCSERFAQ